MELGGPKEREEVRWEIPYREYKRTIPREESQIVTSFRSPRLRGGSGLAASDVSQVL